jgi:hypothetical protein
MMSIAAAAISSHAAMLPRATPSSGGMTFTSDQGSAQEPESGQPF